MYYPTKKNFIQFWGDLGVPQRLISLTCPYVKLKNKIYPIELPLATYKEREILRSTVKTAAQSVHSFRSYGLKTDLISQLG